MNWEWLEHGQRIYGNVCCDSCGRHQPITDPAAGLERYDDENGERWALCDACRPATDSEEA